jgi:hypothetical protein
MFDDKVSIAKYDPNELAVLFQQANKYKTPKAFIEKKFHLAFFKDYFSPDPGLNVKFTVTENKYISKDYLSDYSSYYSSCFEPYQNDCIRLHFFTFPTDNIDDFRVQFKQTVLEGVLKNNNHKTFWDQNYLGFVVIKPIPTNFIGYSLLKHYNYRSDKLFPYQENRTFWGVKKYKIHVFGNEVEVESLAFQEQDGNVAACATMAIWCMLQMAAEDYSVVLKSPNEITLGTGITNHDGNRLMPNQGLTAPLMAQTISANNLVTEIRHVLDKEKDRFNHYLKKLVYAYSPLRIPIILGMNIPDTDDHMIGHAVAICGHEIESLEEYNQKKSKNLIQRILSKKYYDDGILWNAERITKIYAHDDQWGPFARFVLIDGNYIDSAWSSQHTSVRKLTEPVALIVTVFPMIRVSYDDIETIVMGLNQLIIDSFKTIGKKFWDIRLFYSEDFKTKIQQSKSLDDANDFDREIQLWFLSNNFPKFIWIATLLVGDQEVIHFIYDATGLVGSNLLHSIFYYYKEIGNDFYEFLVENRNDEYYNQIFNYSIETYITKLFETQNLSS